MRRTLPPRRTSPWGDAPRLRRILLAIPKTDLHVHLDGSLRPATLLDLARGQGIRLPVRDEEELRRYLRDFTSGVSLRRYLKAFDLTLQVLQEREAIERAAFELAEDSHREGVRYIEVRYSPVLHTGRRLTMHDTVEAVIAGLDRARKRYGIVSGTIVCGLRHLSPRMSYALAKVAVAFAGRGVVGFDLAGAEKDYPAKDHRGAFALVERHHLHMTVHAGEAFGPASIAQALHACGAQRIGHGTRLEEDSQLLAAVNDRRIPLEMCLTSNVQTGAVSTMRGHPFHRYLRAGLRVTLNTDNRLVSDTCVTREFESAVRTFRLGPSDVRHIVLNGFKAAFLPLATRVTLLSQASRDLATTYGRAGIAVDSDPRDLL